MTGSAGPHDDVRDAVRRLIERDVLPVMAGHERAGTFPHAVLRTMGEAGLFGAAFPEEIGGTGLGFGAVAVIAEEISRQRPDLGVAMNAQAMTCPLTIWNWGTDDQVRRFVPDLIAGRRVGMFALSEAGGGSDAFGAMQTVAERRGDRYVLNGSKMWITLADQCEAGLIFARTARDGGHGGVSAFVVEPKTQAGYATQPIAMPGLSPVIRSCAVFLDDVEVPAANRLGEEGEGFKVAMGALDYGRLSVAARLVGAAQACLDLACDYARTRVVGGQAIGRYQMVQQQIADMAVEIDAARLLTRRTAALMDAGQPARRSASYAKYFAGAAARKAAQATAEIFGGYALAADYPVGFFAAHIAMLATGEGSPNVQRILIAEDALGWKDADRHQPRRRLSAPPNAVPEHAGA